MPIQVLLALLAGLLKACESKFVEFKSELLLRSAVGRNVYVCFFSDANSGADNVEELLFLENGQRQVISAEIRQRVVYVVHPRDELQSMQVI